MNVTMRSLIMMQLLILFGKARCSFSYAKFETPNLGRLLYSVKHNPHDALDEYNAINLPDNDPSQRAYLFDNALRTGKTIPVPKIGRNDDDMVLIKELFRPGKNAPLKNCGDSFDKNVWNMNLDGDGINPCFSASPIQSRVKVSSESKSKMIRFPEYFPADSPRLGTRSRELGMSGKLRKGPYLLETDAPQEVKYITYETVSIIPRNNIF